LKKECRPYFDALEADDDDEEGDELLLEEDEELEVLEGSA